MYSFVNFTVVSNSIVRPDFTVVKKKLRVHRNLDNFQGNAKKFFYLLN